MTITLFGWGPLFGIKGPSPFVLKSEVQLQMLGVAFERAIADLDAVAKHKAPYVRLDDGTIVEDSTFIRFHFEKALGKDLDKGLSDPERATAWAIERLLEDRLVSIMAHERWLEPDNFAKGPAQFFARVPEPMREKVVEDVLAKLRQTMVGQGIGRHSRAERMALAERDIEAVARQLGDKPFLMGDAPTAVDAAAFGILTSCSAPIFDTPLRSMLGDRPKLGAFLARMDERFFGPERKWPTPQAAA